MKRVSDEQILEYVAANIDTFHESRLAKLNNLKLGELLSRKNPYLFKSKNIVTVAGLVGSMLDAHLSSQEEELFGVFLEGLAVFIASETVGGKKSSTTGIDLEFEKDGARYIVSIKSGPNWGNSSQVNRMKGYFTEAARVLRQGNRTLNVIAVNGCCYGRDAKPDKGGYFKICGQEFWELISNDGELYSRIIEPLGHNAKERNDTFLENYVVVVNRFSFEFYLDFCNKNGVIDWEKLVEFTSAIQPITAVTPFTPRPIGKRNVNKLRTAANVYNILRYWREDELVERLAFLMSEQGVEAGKTPVNLTSIRGFLLFWSAVESDGDISLDVAPGGLITAEWLFPDGSKINVQFFDIDKVSLTASDAKGQSVKITSRDETVKRQTATTRLIERGWFTRYQND